MDLGIYCKDNPILIKWLNLIKIYNLSMYLSANCMGNPIQLNRLNLIKIYNASMDLCTNCVGNPILLNLIIIDNFNLNYCPGDGIFKRSNLNKFNGIDIDQV